MLHFLWDQINKHCSGNQLLKLSLYLKNECCVSNEFYGIWWRILIIILFVILEQNVDNRQEKSKYSIFCYFYVLLRRGDIYTNRKCMELKHLLWRAWSSNSKFILN